MRRSEVHRGTLVKALEADLIGPYDLENPEAEETLPLPPSRWYLTGFLACEDDTINDDPTAHDELGEGQEEPERAEPGARTPRRKHFPASMGLSMLISQEVRDLSVEISYGIYHRLEPGQPGYVQRGKRAKAAQWRRRAHRRSAQIDLAGDAIDLVLEDGLRLRGEVRSIEGVRGLPHGAKALSLFLVNKRRVPGEGRRDEAYLFQVRMRVTPNVPFLPQPTPNASDDPDERLADLQFRKAHSYAVGHATSVEEDPSGLWVQTCFLPQGRVAAIKTRAVNDVLVDMERLAELESGEALREALWPMLNAYEHWLNGQIEGALEGNTRLRTRAELDAKARVALRRLQGGIDRLAEDPEARQAFCWMNRAMARAARARSPQRYEESSPSWRLFQLAFVILSVVGVCEEAHPERDLVDLIFFPTGGGKTEAYLGVIGFTLLLRRLRGMARPDGGLGVAVLLRYTLRLLTLDQLGRAATLICALELLRRDHPEALGEVRFSVGLWVGQSATANTLKDVNAALVNYKEGLSNDSPCPLANCPWCQSALGADELRVIKGGREPIGVEVTCSDFECEFGEAPGLPLLFVDEQIYRELPSFLLSTVDKLAMLPWRGQSAALFGRVHSHREGRFFGVMDRSEPAKGATPLPDGLPPPELIVQDEVHLISGPLGTMVGLYETAVEQLCRWEAPSGETRRPKIIASTATTRRAEAQMRALFARDVALFPPPGVDDGESFFATHDDEKPDRRYIGVCPVGHPLKTTLLRLYTTTLGAGEALRREEGDAADAWMTALGYFNSLRELGGTRRLIEDVVRSRVSQLSARKPLDHPGPHRWLADREIGALPVELTSRERTSKIAEAKDRLALPHARDRSVDVALATNMISVGVDIDRLGLMLVAGQPKATAEYIQATSRVGRQATTHPGLVVVCLNAQRARDRSHFEHFAAFHQSFYRHVEVNSLTPFSAPALDRGLVGALVAMVRLRDPALTPPKAAGLLIEHRAEAEWVVDALAARARAASDLDAEGEARLEAHVRHRAGRILDAWRDLTMRARGRDLERRYSPFEGKRSSLELLKTHDRLTQTLRKSDDDVISDELLFIAPTSMRDVEPGVDIWVTHGQKIEAERGRGRKTTKADGQIRRSQLLTGYGPGALVDLIDYAVIIGGLGYWRMGDEVPIDDPRLSEKINRGDISLHAPPARLEDPSPARGIQAKIFPRRFVCQRCRALVDYQGLHFKKGRLYHDCVQNKPPLAVPVRFVMACPHGHIDDVDWVGLAHLGVERCATPRLRLLEGSSGDFNEVTVYCEACKHGARVSHLLDPEKRPKCRGRRPWLKGAETTEECDQRARLILRTASNAYFSQTVSALSIPEPSNALYDAVKGQWQILSNATADTLPAFRTLPAIASALGEVGDEQVLGMVERIKAGERPERLPLRVAEFEQLSQAPDDAPGEGPQRGERFFARRALAEAPRGIAGVTLVHALREVRAQIGFTRLDFPNTSIQGEHDLDIRAAQLGLEADWLPAVEIFGEGVFIQLDEAALRAWEARPAVQARAAQLRAGFERYHEGRDKAPEFYGARFYLLHSLSHLLITALSLECGYAASAIRERIYCDAATSAYPMAGILLSTGTPGTEGTLGGLVDQGRRMTQHLERALELGRLCSNDPVCVGHDPSDEAGRPMEGAACHGCLFIAESSCEWFNRALDRALVVPTLGNDPQLAFFHAP